MPGPVAAGYNQDMLMPPEELLTFHKRPQLHKATMLLAFTGWMDGGDVSTGTVQRLVGGGKTHT